MPMVVLVVWMMAAGVTVVVMRMVVVVVGAPMIMGVIASVPVVMIVAVGLRWVALRLHIGAAFGIERRLERDHARPETRGHRLDDGVPADAQRLWRYFSRQM